MSSAEQPVDLKQLASSGAVIGQQVQRMLIQSGAMSASGKVLKVFQGPIDPRRATTLVESVKASALSSLIDARDGIRALASKRSSVRWSTIDEGSGLRRDRGSTKRKPS